MNFLYNYRGVAIAHIKNNVIYSINGKPLAFLNHEYVYLYNSYQVGVYENGWLRDLNGFCVFYSENYSGFAPIPPIHHIPPVPAVPQIPPILPIPQIPRVKAICQGSWSKYKGEDFFEIRR